MDRNLILVTPETLSYFNQGEQCIPRFITEAPVQMEAYTFERTLVKTLFVMTRKTITRFQGQHVEKSIQGLSRKSARDIMTVDSLNQAMESINQAA